MLPAGEDVNEWIAVNGMSIILHIVGSVCMVHSVRLCVVPVIICSPFLALTKAQFYVANVPITPASPTILLPQFVRHCMLRRHH